MDINALKTQSMIAGAKLFLATTSPLQNLLDRPGITHEFCNRQAVSILHHDGFSRYAAFLDKYLPEINAGVLWADKGWKNVSHYFVPTSGVGLWKFANAVEDFQVYFQTALNSARDGNVKRSMFFLGAACHLVQDLCVPHHARAKLLFGHKNYEAWVQSRFENYAVSSHGIYQEESIPQTLLITNAVTAADLLSWVDEDTLSSYHAATIILLPRAQRSTAGLFLKFFTAVSPYYHFLQGLLKIA